MRKWRIDPLLLLLRLFTGCASFVTLFYAFCALCGPPISRVTPPILEILRSSPFLQFPPYAFRDVHTTILHQLGLDQHKLTYPHLGRNERLTFVEGKVIDEIV